MSLTEKYNIPGPRYTSYPTVPYWDEVPPSQEAWLDRVGETFKSTNSTEGISLYIHLPYCESLCTYCGCNMRVTVNHGVEDPYIRNLLLEWAMYLRRFDEKPRLREIHLGGGTPTFFSPENLKALVEGILADCEVCEDYEFGFEGHPNNTTEAHLQTLFDLGFRRVSYGIQDFDPRVQEIVNRVQTFETVENITRITRKIGYSSINFDLIYGLPLQTPESVRDTVEKVGKLRPDRIAFYSYAHVPWVKPGQRKFTEADLPEGEAKRHLYELGSKLLLQLGYLEIGMDHFALVNDPLFEAFGKGKLHRNFMGYTPWHTRLLIGLGASSISDCWTAFVQNRKKIEDYNTAIEAGELPFFKGHLLDSEDQILRQHILNIMCNYQTNWREPDLKHPSLLAGIGRMDSLLEDGLIELSDDHLRVTKTGEPFVRNIAMALDARLARRQPDKQIFSTTA